MSIAQILLEPNIFLDPNRLIDLYFSSTQNLNPQPKHAFFEKIVDISVKNLTIVIPDKWDKIIDYTLSEHFYLFKNNS